MKAIILFDLDGTLIDSTQAIVESFYHTLSEHNLPKVEQDSITKQIGHTLSDMFLSMNVKKELIPELLSTYKAHYRKICNEKTKLLPNAKEAILQAHTFAHLGVVTTKTGQYSKMLLEHFGVLKYFNCVIGIEDVKEPKPSAEPILKALEYFPKDIKQIIMIGDTPLDIQAANNANIQNFALTCGYSSKETLKQYTQNIANNALEAVIQIKNNIEC